MRTLAIVLLAIFVAIVARAGTLGSHGALSGRDRNTIMTPGGICCQPQIVFANSDRLSYTVGDTVFVSAVYNLVYAGNCNPTCDNYLMVFENITGNFGFYGDLPGGNLPPNVVHTAWFVPADPGTFTLRVGVNDQALLEDGYLYAPAWTITVAADSLPRLSAADIVYLGRFKVPCDSSDGAGTGCVFGDINEMSLASGGSSLAYSDSGSTGADSADGFPGTLFISGYSASYDNGCGTPKGGKIARITIPVPSPSGPMLKARVTMNLTDVCQPYFDDITCWNAQQRMGDVFWTSDSMLYGSVYGYYNADTQDRDHLWRNKDDCTNLSTLLHIGPHVTDKKLWSFYRKNCDYIFEIPRWWANRYTGGKWLAVGNGSREGGHAGNTVNGRACTDQDAYDDAGRIGCHLGPGFTTFAPESVNAHAADSSYEVPAVECAGYHHEHPASMAWDDPSDPEYFSDTDFWTDGAWVTTGAFEDSTTAVKSAVMFLVEKCNHWSHYMHGPPTSYCVSPEDNSDCCGHDTEGFICGGDVPEDYPDPPPPGEDGMERPCKSPLLWLFDPNDYINVAQGTVDPWTPRCYEVVDLSLYFENSSRECTDGWLMKCGGMAYDKTRRLLYVCEEKAWQSGCCSFPPVIHVFHIGGTYP